MKASFILLIIALIIASAASVAAQDAELNDIDEVAADNFHTLEDMGVADEPAASFAEIDSTSTPSAEVAHPVLVEQTAEAEAEVERRRHLKPWHRSHHNQPVNRSRGKEIQCLDGDCTRAHGVRKARIGHHPNANTKKVGKLEIALGAVKEEIMVRAKELHKEKDWSKKVAHLIDEYQQKLAKVDGNIVHLRAQTKALLRKKKQIQNVQVQNKLRYKLQLAQADLNRLQKQMEHIAGKENEFSDTEKQLKGTMNALKNSLLKLRGQETQKLEAEGIAL